MIIYSLTNWRKTVMSILLLTDRIDEYLKKDDIINYENVNIAQLAESLFSNADSDVQYIKKHTNL